MGEDNDPSKKFNIVYARDRAAVGAAAILSVIKDVLDDPELRARVAAILRSEFADLVREVFSENRPNGE